MKQKISYVLIAIIYTAVACVLTWEICSRRYQKQIIRFQLMRDNPRRNACDGPPLVRPSKALENEFSDLAKIALEARELRKENRPFPETYCDTILADIRSIQAFVDQFPNVPERKRPNQALVPTPASVTPAANAPVAPAAGAAHL